MPMEILVICVGDLATLGRVRVGLDLGLFSPWSFSLSLFCPRCFGEWKVFTMAVPLRSGRIEFLRRCNGSKTHGGTLADWTIFGCSVSALPDFLDFMGIFPD